MLTLNLPSPLETRLRDRAAEAGLEPELFAVTVLDESLREKLPQEMTEAELRLEASRGLATPTWRRYHDLIDGQAERELTETERRELLELNDLVETTHARRMTFVVELARRHGVPLRDMMDELGFPNYPRE